jgi:hypothetical protein
MDIEKIQISTTIYYWGLSIGLALIVMAFMLVTVLPNAYRQPCLVANFNAPAQQGQAGVR